MKKLKIFLTYISSNRVWIITLACLDVFFIFLAWLANPDYFINYVALIIFVSFATLAIPLAISIRKRNKTDAIFMEAIKSNASYTNFIKNQSAQNLINLSYLNWTYILCSIAISVLVILLLNQTKQKSNKG